jgi:hypothetical protein
MMVPNGIDVTRFEAARPQRDEMRQKLGVAAGETLLLFPASKFFTNKEAYDWLVHFIEDHPAEIAKRKLKFCVVGSVVPHPEEHGPLKATARVEFVEPYFAAADVALNPMFSGAGTNVKMADFIAARLPDSHHRFWRARLRVGQRQERLVLRAGDVPGPRRRGAGDSPRAAPGAGPGGVRRQRPGHRHEPLRAAPGRLAQSALLIFLSSGPESRSSSRRTAPLFRSRPCPSNPFAPP